MSAPKQAVSDKLAVERQLTIKLGATRRLLKEHRLYTNEAEEHQRKVDRVIAENGEEWDIKNAKKILDESQRMIKDTANRLKKAVQELALVVELAKSRPEFSEDEGLLVAQNGLTEASAQLVNVP